MVKLNAPIERFNVGEYSESGQQRVDIDRTRFAAGIQENLFPAEIGKAQVRPGTTYLAQNNSSVKLIPFVRSPSDKALLELSGGQLRILIDDEILSRPATSSTWFQGTPLSLANWTESEPDGAAISYGGSGATFGPNARGAQCWAQGTASTFTILPADYGKEHAVRIEVTEGPVRFRMGSVPGKDDLIAETFLDRGWHSLAFTPYGQVYPRFSMLEAERRAIVASIDLEAAGEVVIDAPWSSTDLPLFQYEQSHDVIFLANKNIAPMKIERRGDGRSWSVVYYETEDGPFRDIPPGFGEIGATVGVGLNTTFSVEEPVLDADMEGSLVRIFHETRNNTVQLAGEDTWTDTYRITGILGENVNDRKYDYNVSGTGTGTISFQRSISGEDGDYQRTNIKSGTSTSTIAMPATVGQAHNGEEEDNNLLAYHRIGYKAGDYTSGVTSVNINYQGDSGYGRGRITNVTPTSALFQTIERVNAENSESKVWQIGAWSDFYEWPQSVAIWDNRLWWGGRDRIWGSARNTLYNFDDLEAGDTSTIQRQLSSGGASLNAHFLLPAQRLLIGTSGGELSLRSSAVGEVITDSNATIRTASNFGAAPIQPVKIDSRGVFVHRDGVTSMLLNFTNAAGDYASAKLTEYNDEILLPGCTQLAVSRQPETYIWHVREDGQIAILLLDPDAREEPLLCWTRFVTDGVVTSAAVLPGDEQDEVYIAVNRQGQADLTGAEELSQGYSGFVSVDFLDMSAVSTETGVTQAATYSDTIDEWGRGVGPDAMIYGFSNLNFSGDPIYTRKDDGRYTLNFHNTATGTEDLTNKTMVNASLDTTTYTAPNGDQTGTIRLQGNGTNGWHYVRLTPQFGTDDAVFSSQFSSWSRPDNHYSTYFKFGGSTKVEFTIAAWDSFLGNGGDPWANDLEQENIRVVVNTTNGTIESETLQHYEFPATSEYYILHWRPPEPVREQHDGQTNVKQPVEIYRESHWEPGWYRIIIRCWSRQDSGFFGVRLLENGTDNNSFSGSTDDGVLLWGWQHNWSTMHDDRYVANPSGVFRSCVAYEWDADGTARGALNWPSYDSNIFHIRGTSSRSTAIAGAYWPLVDEFSTRDATYGLGAQCGSGWSIWEPDHLCPDGTYSACRIHHDGEDTPGGIMFIGDSWNIYQGYSGTGYMKSSFWIKPSECTASHLQMAAYFSNTYDHTPDQEFWSVTFDIRGSVPVVTQDFYQEGSGAAHITERNIEYEVWPNGWVEMKVRLYYPNYSQFLIINWINTGGVASGAAYNLPYWTRGQTGTFLQQNAPRTGVLVWGETNEGYLGDGYWRMTRPAPMLEYTGPHNEDINNSNFNIRLQEEMPNAIGPDMNMYMWQEVESLSERNDEEFRSEDTFGWEDSCYFANLYIDQFFNAGGYWFQAGIAKDYRSKDWAFKFDDFYEDYGPWPDPPGNRIDGDPMAYDTVKQLAWQTQGAIKDGSTVSFWEDGVFKGSQAFTGREFLEGSDADEEALITFGDTEISGDMEFFYARRLLFTTDQVVDGGAPFRDANTQFIEKINLLTEARGATVNKMADSGLFFEGPVSSVTLAHLTGRDVVAWGTRNGIAQPITGLTADGQGVVDLGDIYTDVFVGLPYSARYRSSKLAYAGEGGTSIEQDKVITQVGLLLTDTHKDAVKYGQDFDRMRSMPEISRGKPIPDNTVHETYDDVTFSFPGRWDTDSRVHLKVDAPYPATFTGLVVGVETNSRGGKNPRR